MKKFLLSVFAIAGISMAANAETVIDSYTNYSTVSTYQNWASDEAKAIMEIKDGALVLTNTEERGFWIVQYMVSGTFAVTPNVEYTVSAKIRSNVSGNITAVLGTWGEGNSESSPLSITGDNEWHEVSTKINPLSCEESFVLFQSGNLVGTIEIAWVEVSHADAVQIPTTGDVIASFYDGKGGTIGGWGNATFENVEEDGKPCLKFTNEKSQDSWGVQIAINYDFTVGTKYYLSFDIKGTPVRAMSSGFQGARNYAGCGSMSKFNITENWEHVIIYGVPYDAAAEGEESNPPSRWLADLGQYVGTFYMTNVQLYTETGTGSMVSEVIADNEGRTVVYNLMGVKVLDTEDASMLSTLPAGFYIVNGKKVIL